MGGGCRGLCGRGSGGGGRGASEQGGGRKWSLYMFLVFIISTHVMQLLLFFQLLDTSQPRVCVVLCVRSQPSPVPTPMPQTPVQSLPFLCLPYHFPVPFLHSRGYRVVIMLHAARPAMPQPSPFTAPYPIPSLVFITDLTGPGSAYPRS